MLVAEFTSSKQDQITKTSIRLGANQPNRSLEHLFRTVLSSALSHQYRPRYIYHHFLSDAQPARRLHRSPHSLANILPRLFNAAQIGHESIFVVLSQPAHHFPSPHPGVLSSAAVGLLKQPAYHHHCPLQHRIKQATIGIINVACLV